MTKKASSAKALTTSDELGRIVLPPVRGLSGMVQRLYGWLFGRSEAPVYNCEGVAVQLEGALMREHGSHNFTLALRFGDRVLGALEIPAHDPALKDLPLVRFGPSPEELEAQRVREERAAMTPEEQLAIEMRGLQGIGVNPLWRDSTGKDLPRAKPKAA